MCIQTHQHLVIKNQICGYISTNTHSIVSVFDINSNHNRMKFSTLLPAIALIFVGTATMVRANDDAPITGQVESALVPGQETDGEIARVQVPDGRDDDEFDFVPVEKENKREDEHSSSVLPITSTITASGTNTVQQTVVVEATSSVTNTVTASATETVAILEVTPTAVETVTSTSTVIASTEVTVSERATVTVSATEMPTETAVVGDDEHHDDDDYENSAGHIKAGAAAVVAVFGGLLIV